MVKMQFDFSKLRGRIVEKHRTIGNFSTIVGIPRGQLSAKICGHTGFTFTDVYRICQSLDIPSEEIGVYFFTPKVEQERLGGNDGTDS